MASDRDHQAARLRRQQWSYPQITDHLGYSDRRAAHRGVQRSLAEPVADEAVMRGLRMRAVDEQLIDVSRRLEVLLERHQPPDPMADHRPWNRIRVALFRVTVQRCRLWGRFVHPWRHDHLWRRDVPVEVWLHLQLQANRLERETRVPVRWRAPEQLPSVVPGCVVQLREVVTPLVDVDSVVPAGVRQLLDQLAA